VANITPIIKTMAPTTINRILTIGFFFLGSSAPSVSAAGAGAAVAMLGS